MEQSRVFGAGVPVILVPAMAPAGVVDHLAIAWDESRVGPVSAAMLIAEMRAPPG